MGGWLPLNVVVLAAIVATACGSGTLSPTMPSSPGSAAPLGGATIQGNVLTGSSVLGFSTGAAAASLTVTIVGTNMATTVTGTGQFTSTSVPSGTIQLKFTGPGVDATVTITGVESSETIMLTIAISGNNATVRTETRGGGNEAVVNGTISNLTGSASSFQFNVGSRLVRGDGLTQFFGDVNKSDSFADLHSRVRVEVKGQNREGFVYAVRLHINDGEDDDDKEEDEADEAEIEGRINSIASGTTLVVGSATVLTSASTVVRRRGVVQALSVLQFGMTIEVEGTRNANGWITAKKIQIEEEEDDGEDGDSKSTARLEGPPLLTLDRSRTRILYPLAAFVKL